MVSAEKLDPGLQEYKNGNQPQSFDMVEWTSHQVLASQGTKFYQSGFFKLIVRRDVLRLLETMGPYPKGRSWDPT
ncbi:hypothetical protein TNCV_3469191 [Trichonephila clavipes]|nr:hypothetical protein TNCV_3469191 [Trichonephila clavipes]